MISQISSLHGSLIGSCLGAWLLVTACGFVPANTPQVTPTCISSTPETNPYLSHPVTRARDIYSNSVTNLGNARQEALFQLGQNMEHWSAQVDIANDNNHMVRIIVTYLDPALVQYIVLNQLINDPAYLASVMNSPLNVMSFDFELDKVMQQLSARNEMLFIVTFASPFYHKAAFNSPELIVKFPIEQLMLSSASNMQVKPTHFDPILDESMDITQGPVSGIVGYPIALAMNEDQCTLIIDQWTNTLTLDIPSITLGNISSSSKFWNIAYRSLVMQSDTHPTPTFDPNALNNPINKLNEPPTPSWTPMPGFDNTNSQQLYWEEMGRYIWNQVITQSHH